MSWFKVHNCYCVCGVYLKQMTSFALNKCPTMTSTVSELHCQYLCLLNYFSTYMNTSKIFHNGGFHLLVYFYSNPLSRHRKPETSTSCVSYRYNYFPPFIHLSVTHWNSHFSVKHQLLFVGMGSSSFPQNLIQVIMFIYTCPYPHLHLLFILIQSPAL